jgi:peptidoglycan hydrolase-like protein with peptidoglycan-binding domain
MTEYRILVPPPRRHRLLWIVLAVVVVVALASGAYVLGRHGAGSARAGGANGAGGAAVTSTTRPVPLAVLATVPADGAADVPSDQVVTVHFSDRVSTAAGMPTFNPPVAGVWSRSGPASLSFTPSAPFIPTTTETLVIPAGSAGPRGAGGRVLAAPDTVTFTVTQASTERLQQMLAQLGYLPVGFTASAPVPSPAQAFEAQTGTFHWRWPGTPPSLAALWTEGTENVITKGAVMNFENQNGLTVDGLAGREVWTDLLADTTTGKVNADPYTYAFVTKQLPETLTLYANGSPALPAILVNTGAPGADTADGTYPVFEHVVASRMQGTNPDGSTYDDPAVPWASFFNGGDALHGFVRASYGFPQSNGCVEMPVATAAKVWPLTPIGTLVTVVGPTS